MQVEPNEGGGKSVFLTAGDRLSRVPKSHRELITPLIEEVFADPIGHFHELALAVRSFPAFSKWLKELLKEGLWALWLHRGDPPSWTEVGFYFLSEKVRTAEITPSGRKVPRRLPSALREYYSLVDRVSWMPFGCAGNLDGADEHPSLTNFDFEYHGADIDPAKTFVFGWSPGGDMLIYTQDDRGGWLCHENGKIYLLGSVRETINWVYEELLADRCPLFNYDWA
jgi:hypothetical protein